MPTAERLLPLERVCGEPDAALKVSFQVWFKEGGFSGRKQCCSEGTNLLDKALLRNVHGDPEKFWI